MTRLRVASVLLWFVPVVGVLIFDLRTTPGLLALGYTVPLALWVSCAVVTARSLWVQRMTRIDQMPLRVSSDVPT
jgi:hypothetical protein